MKVVLLPGMDGGAALLRPFRRALALPSVVHGYSPTRPEPYEDLLADVRRRVVSTQEPVAVVAESFSGPLAIELAARPPPGLCAVVLVATFAESPRPRALGSLVGPWLFRRPPPAMVVRRLLLDEAADPAMVSAVQAAVGRCSPVVLASRLRAVLHVDVREALARAALPGLVLHGTRDRLVPRPPKAPAHWERDAVEGPHLLLQARAEDAAQRIARFLAPYG
ncbi:MAG: alpha/beta hydrolase [Myxococcota bacterium]